MRRMLGRGISFMPHIPTRGASTSDAPRVQAMADPFNGPKNGVHFYPRGRSEWPPQAKTTAPQPDLPEMADLRRCCHTLEPPRLPQAWPKQSGTARQIQSRGFSKGTANDSPSPWGEEGRDEGKRSAN